MAVEINKSAVSISTATLFKILAMVLAVVSLYLIRDIALAILVSVVVASSVEPAIQWGIRWRLPRGVMTFAVYFVVLALILGVVPTLLTSVLHDVVEFVSVVLPQNLTSFTEEARTATSTWWSVSWGGSFSLAEVMTDIRGALQSIQGNLLSAASFIFGGIVQFFLVVIFSFYLSIQEKGVEKFIRLVTPAAHQRYAVDLWYRARHKIGWWMRGQVLLAILVGILTYLGLVILGVRYALTFAVVATILDLIPFFGPIVAAVPAMLVGFVDGGFTSALMVAGLFIIVNQFESYIFQPLVVKRATGVSPLVIVLAIIIGAKLAGFVGIVLAAPAAAVIQEWVNDLETRRWRKVKVDVQ